MVHDSLNCDFCEEYDDYKSVGATLLDSPYTTLITYH